MDHEDLQSAKMFLGQEFLTWLWFASEELGALDLGDEKSVSLILGETLILGPALGQEGARVAVRGPETSLAEAREALRRGKLVGSMRLGLEIEGDEFWLTLKAADLGLTSLKLPAAPGESPEDEQGRQLERIYLIDLVYKTIERLFSKFLAARLEDEQGGAMWAQMKSWAQAMPGL
jgi:hypothetical protein